MLSQTCVTHLFRKRRQLGARRQDLLIELQERLELRVGDPDDANITVALTRQAVFINTVLDVDDMKFADAKAASIPWSHTQIVKRDVLQGARRELRARNLCHLGNLLLRCCCSWCCCWHCCTCCCHLRRGKPPGGASRRTT